MALRFLCAFIHSLIVPILSKIFKKRLFWNALLNRKNQAKKTSTVFRKISHKPGACLILLQASDEFSRCFSTNEDIIGYHHFLHLLHQCFWGEVTGNDKSQRTFQAFFYVAELSNTFFDFTVLREFCQVEYSLPPV